MNLDNSGWDDTEADRDSILDQLHELRGKMRKWRNDPDFFDGDQGYQRMGSKESELEERLARLDHIQDTLALDRETNRHD